MADAAPLLHTAICQLVGGEKLVRDELTLNAGFVVNYEQGADQPWEPPQSARGGWHVDGDFNQFLDSPEAGLFFILCYNDIELQAGPTYLAPDSIGPIVREMLGAPGGLSAYQLRTSHNVKAECSARSVPCMGKAGTAYLAHPAMLHSSSQNIKRQPRFMRNGQVALARPRAFDPDGPLSPVERCTLRNLGLSTAELRQQFVPPPETLRQACDHDDGGLLPWKYGHQSSYRGGKPPTSATEKGRADAAAAARAKM